jgi:uncharacterized iron-regulated protein
MKHVGLSMFCLLFLALSLAGCAKKTARPSWFLRLASMGPHLESEEIIKLPEGDPISLSQLTEDLHSSRVIYVGEAHDQFEHHQVEVKMLQELLKEGREVVVAMEMFQRSQQPILDRWSQGSLSEEDFLKEVPWETTWGIDYSFYRGILDTVREHHLRVLGLNISKDLSRKVAQAGIESLSPGDRSGLPEMDLNDRDHRRYIRSFYKAHKRGPAKGFEFFYQAQCLWDEAMAEAISDFLKSPEGEGKTILVFAGNGHVVFGFGIPKRLYRRVSLPYQTITLKEWRKGMDEDFIFSLTSEPLADFLWITRPSPPEKKRPRIGIVLKETEDPKGIVIERVIPESPAERAGLLPGDQFVSIDGKEVKSLKDIHDAVAHKGWGKQVTLTILRDGIKKDIPVALPLPKED